MDWQIFPGGGSLGLSDPVLATTGHVPIRFSKILTPMPGLPRGHSLIFRRFGEADVTKKRKTQTVGNKRSASRSMTGLVPFPLISSAYRSNQTAQPSRARG